MTSLDFNLYLASVLRKRHYPSIARDFVLYCRRHQIVINMIFEKLLKNVEKITENTQNLLKKLVVIKYKHYQ